MKLSDWLERENMRHADFGRRIGVTEVSISRYVTGTRRPDWTVLERIQRETNGEVTPNDFLDRPGEGDDPPFAECVSA